MKPTTGLWDGLRTIVSHRLEYWKSLYREHRRHQQWNQRQPLTIGEMLYDLIYESTDTYRRRNHLRYPGGPPSPLKYAPVWVTKKGANLSLLYRHQIAYVVYRSNGESHHEPQY